MAYSKYSTILSEMVQLMLLGIISDGGKRWPALVPFSTEKVLQSFL